MWSSFVLCLLVGFVHASTSPAWRDRTEYVYMVRGRTLSSLHEAADYYSGFSMKLKLYLSLRSDGKLQGRISDAQYAQVRDYLPGGWESELPESHLPYEVMPLTNGSFQMVIQDGLITKLIVEKKSTLWETNMIKGILSQFQWDIQGKNLIDSPINNLPTEDRFDGVFKTMEETVTGKTETLYQIHPYSEYLLQSKWLPVPKLNKDDQVIEVVKSKNYTNAEARPSYHYGFAELKNSEPSSQKMGQFFARESYSSAVLSGKPSAFLIQKAQTVNKILVNPTFNNKHMGSVFSMINVTLSKLNPQDEDPKNLNNPCEIGDLVYTYEGPFVPSEQVQCKQSVGNFEDDFSEEMVYKRTGPRFHRSAMQEISKSNKDQFVPERSQYQSTYVDMHNAPEFPLLPYFMGYYGRSIKMKEGTNPNQIFSRIITEIAEEIQDPQEILRQSTMEKFTILCSLFRLLDREEIEPIAEYWYAKSKKDPNYLYWSVVRNAIAEAGTGPAFNVIKRYIDSVNIKEFQAAETVATMARSVRTPTLQYMKAFYELVADPKVREQAYLNETAILSFTDLVYKVYVNRNQSNNQFPTHIFGPFDTEEGRDFVKSTVIPYFSEQLQDAIVKADARKIHVYIRALGNIAHKKILQAFKPYLEGQKQASQFQRLLMVIALDRLVEHNPVVARSVCYKIYQNLGEIPEIRVVAVYQLMKTNPSVDMLHVMAESTNTEPHKQVIAAVKSAIESASLLRSSEYQYLQKAAKSAKPLLTKQYHAGDYSYIEFRDYITENINTEFGHNFLVTRGQDSQWPKTIKLAVGANLNGLLHQSLKVSAMASSITEIMNVLYRQTKEYEEAERDRNGRPDENKWSSANVAKLLNYEREEREQLEAVVFAELEHLQKLWYFDNQTLERLPKDIQEQEEDLRNGKQINYNTLRQLEEKALSFPTEMGVPFLYTYNIPLLVRVQGNVSFVANPQISSNNKLRKPDHISVNIDGNLTVSAGVQSRLSFVAPFNQQVYLAGFDKTIQGHLPIKADAEVDIKDKEAEIKFEVKKSEKDVHLLHYRATPYISLSSLMDIRPVASKPNFLKIKPKTNHYFDVGFGKNETGMTFRAWGQYPVQSRNFRQLAEMLRSQNIVNMWEELWDKAMVQQTEVNIAWIPRDSSVRQFTVRFGKQNKFMQKPDVPTEEEFLTFSQLSSKLETVEIKERQEKIINHVSSGIQSAKLLAYDVSVEFEGEQNYQHILGFAMAKSNAGPKSRSLIYYKKNTNEQKQFAVQVKAYIPNTNGLDLTYALRNKPQATYTGNFLGGQNENDASVISGRINLLRSKDRENYLLHNEPLKQICNKEMSEGNFQLPACQNLTIQANYFDHIKIEMDHKNLKREYVDVVEGFFKGIRLYYYPMTEVQTIPSQEKHVSLEIQFEPKEFRLVNVTVKAEDEETKIFNLTIYNHIVKTLVVSHPVFHVKSRILGLIKGWENFRPTCVIDQTAAQTFSNRTYPLSLGKQYTVVMQYTPHDARWEGQKSETVTEMLKRQHENYVVLARQMTLQHKDLLITFNHKETKGETVEINMKLEQEASNPAVITLVNGKKIGVSNKTISDHYNGLVQIYALPNGEVKVEFKDAFYIIFDGKRLKVTATGNKLLNSISGLCGRFSLDKYEDFTVPSKCVVRDSTEFIRSYLGESQKYSKQQCVQKVMPLYTKVISDHDTDVLSDEENSRSTQLRHRYVEEGGEMCFTIHPVPVCNSPSSNIVSKNIPVHCIQSTKTAYYFKKQIDQGFNPNFSQKSETRKIPMDIPMSCN